MYPTTSTSSNENLIRNTTQIRNQENPHHHDTQYNLMCNLKEKGINVDLGTLRKVVNAIEVLPEYFPETRQPDCNNPKHMETMSLLLAVQENNSTHLQKYSEIEVVNAMNLLVNHGKKDVENLKAGLRDSSMVNGLIGSVPIAGAYFQDLFKKSMQPGIEASIGIEDIINLGCRGEDGYISDKNLLPVARCNLDKQAEKHLIESLAYHATKQDDEMQLFKIRAENSDLNNSKFQTQILEQSEAQFNKVKGSLEFLEAHAKEQQKRNIESDKQEEIAKKNKKWSDVATRLRAIGDITQTITNHLEAHDEIKDRSNANIKSVQERAKKLGEALTENPLEKPRPMFFQTQSKNSDQLLENIRKNMSLIQSALDVEMGIASKQQSDGNRIASFQKQIGMHYAEIEKDRRALGGIYQNINLVSSVLSKISGATLNPIGSVVSAGLYTANAGVQFVGHFHKKPLEKELKSTTKNFNKIEKVGSNLLDRKGNTQGNIYNLSSQQESLKQSELSILQNDSSKIQEFIDTLGESLSKAQKTLESCEENKDKTADILKHMTSGVDESLKNLNNNRNKEIHNWSRNKQNEQDRKVEKLERFHLEEVNKKTEAEENNKRASSNVDTAKNNVDAFKKELGRALDKDAEIKHQNYISSDSVVLLKEYEKKFDLINKLYSPSEDLLFSKLEKTVSITSNGVALSQDFLRKSLVNGMKLVSAIDKSNLFKYKLSELIPSAAPEVIMEGAKFYGSMVEFNCAIRAVGTFVGDKKKELGIDDTLTVLKNLTDDEVIKAGMMLLGPVSQGIVVGLQLYSFLNEEEGHPDPYLQGLQDLKKEMFECFEEIDSHISNVEGAVSLGFSESREHLVLMEKSIFNKIDTLGHKIDNIELETKARDHFLPVRLNIGHYKLQNLSDYSLYIEQAEYDLETQEIKKILAFLKIGSKEMLLSDKNGLWLHKETRVDQLSVALYNPSQTTGLLTSHLDIDRNAPDFYQYEHYTHIFNQLSAKILSNKSNDSIQKEISNLSTQLVEQGQSLEKLFDSETVDLALEKYMISQTALIEQIKGTIAVYKYEDEYSIKTDTIPVVNTSTDFNYLEKLNAGFLGDRIKVSLKANEKTYTDLYYQNRDSHFKAKLIDLYHYFVRNTLDKDLFTQRTFVINTLSKEINDLKFLEKSLVSIWEDKQFQRITPKKRQELRGNFIELAYDVYLKQRQINFCHFNQKKNLGEDPNSTNPIHTQVAFCLENQLDEDSEITNKNNELTQKLRNNKFSDLFSFSVILSAEAQSSHDLSGRTFVVLSDCFHDQGLKRLQHQEEIDTVEFGNRFYKKQPTLDDGACALHALLGEKDITGIYKKKDARQELVKKLTADRFGYVEARFWKMGRNNSPDNIRNRRDKLNQIKSVLEQEIKNILSLPSEQTGITGETPKRGTSFVKKGTTQSIDELNILMKQLPQKMDIVHEAFGYIKDRVGPPSRDGLFNDFHDTNQPHIIQKELKKTLNSIHNNLHTELLKKGLCLDLPKDLADKMLWDETEPDRYFAKKFNVKLVEILSKLSAIRWIDENQSLVTNYIAFQNTLSQGYGLEDYRSIMEPKHRDLLNELLVEHLNRALIGEDLSSKMLFFDESNQQIISKIECDKQKVERLLKTTGSSKELFKEWKSLKETENSLREAENKEWMRLWNDYLDEPEDMFGNIGFVEKVCELAPLASSGTFKCMNAEKIQQKISEKPVRIVEVIDVNRTAFLNLIRSKDRQIVSTIALKRNNNLQEQTNFINKPQLFKHYINTIQDEDFWFNKKEIELVSYLFDKKSQVVSKDHGQDIPTSHEPYNNDLIGDPIIICNEGLHFSRCEPLAKSTESYINELVARIPQTQNVKVEKLIENYKEFINYSFKGTPFDTKKPPNPFNPNLEKSIYKKCTFLSSTNEDQTLLAFPDTVLDYIENVVAPKGIRRTKMKIARSYSFVVNRGTGCYELAIDYQHKEKEYLKFIIAQFGMETVQAFRDHNVSGKDSFESAFLIQAMYGDGLSLPGEGSFKILSIDRNPVFPILSVEKFSAIYPRLAKEKNKRVDHAIPKSMSAIATICDQPLPCIQEGFFLADKAYHIAFQESVDKLKNDPVYKTAKESYLLLKAILKLTIGKDALDAIRIPNPDMVIQSDSKIGIRSVGG